jgi:PST family polysaccharide transporter
MLLGIAVFLRCAAGGETALLQGLRRIPELALTSIIGALATTVGTILLVWSIGERGITAAIVLAAAAGLAAALWFSRRVGSGSSVPSNSQVRELYLGLLSLGIVFMVGILGQHVGAYVVRTAVFRELGADSAGYYHAAWTIGGLYIGMILAAVGTDFYPRLVAAYTDPKRCNAIVNEQVRVSVLLAGPGVLATLTFSSLALSLLYSADFQPAAGTLRWICAGMALRVVTWPLGFVIVAGGRKVALLSVEIGWTVFYVVGSLVLIQKLGLVGAGVAFALSYVLHWALVFPIVRRLTGFSFDAENRRLILLYLGAVVLVTAAFDLGNGRLAVAFGVCVVIASVGYASRQAWNLVESEMVPRRLKRIVERFARYVTRREGGS